jgi:hypothetical protein
MYENQDQQILRQLRRKKQSFKQLISKRQVDDFELDKAFGSDF